MKGSERGENPSLFDLCVVVFGFFLFVSCQSCLHGFRVVLEMAKTSAFNSTLIQPIQNQLP